MERLFQLGLWVQSHWVELGVTVGYAVAIARLIVKLTPTPADDSALARVIDVLKHLGLALPAESISLRQSSSTKEVA